MHIQLVKHSASMYQELPWALSSAANHPEFIPLGCECLESIVSQTNYSVVGQSMV